MTDALYQKLGLQRGASRLEIKAAFRRLALAHHPDRHGGSPAAALRFQELVNAYNALLKIVPTTEVEELPAPPAPRSSRAAGRAPQVDLGILGLFLGLATAAVSAVLWHTSTSRVKRSRRAATAY